MSRELDALLHFVFLTASILCWIGRGRHNSSRYITLSGLFLIVTFVFDGAAAAIMLSKSVEGNLFLYHILTPIQFVIIVLIYHDVIKNQVYRKITRWLIPVFLFGSALLSFTIQPFSEEYNSYSILIKHLVTILSILIYFYEIISTTPYNRIYLQPIFWISVGFLFHSVLNILLEGFSNYLQTYGDSKYEVIYLLYSLSNYCLFILMGVGFIVSRNKADVNESESIARQ